MTSTARLIAQMARRRNLDPQAVLSVFRGEGGLEPRAGLADVGDRTGPGLFSVGPGQLYSRGALPGWVSRRGVRFADEWAWSPEGLRYLMDRVAQVARGLRGEQAIEAIIRKFERPADPDRSVALALERYRQGSPADQSVADPSQSVATSGLDPRAMFAAQLLSQRRPSVAPVLLPLVGAGSPGAEAVPAPGGSSGGKVTMPLSTPLPKGSEFLVADPEGAPGPGGRRYHGALDWFAPAGSPVVSPVDGVVVEVRRSKTNSGQVFGGTVKVKGADGKVWVFRHVDPQGLKVGQRVRPGDPLASVSAWRSGSPHAHLELWKTLEGGYALSNMLDPIAFLR